MAKRILKAREVDRLENTTLITAIAIGDYRGICDNCDNTCTNIDDLDICSNCRNTCTNIGDSVAIAIVKA